MMMMTRRALRHQYGFLFLPDSFLLCFGMGWMGWGGRGWESRDDDCCVAVVVMTCISRNYTSVVAFSEQRTISGSEARRGNDDNNFDFLFAVGEVLRMDVITCQKATGILCFDMPPWPSKSPGGNLSSNSNRPISLDEGGATAFPHTGRKWQWVGGLVDLDPRRLLRG